MKYTALIPVKTLDMAKSRLAPHLSRQQRATLVLEMLRHVLQTLHTSEAFEQIYVVSADPSVLTLAQDWGAQPLRETQQGHNPALQEAAHTIRERSTWQHETWAAWHPQEQQERALLTISADLPLLAQEDIILLLKAAEQAQVVLASSSDGTGTNALLTRPPLVLPYLFGPNSLAAYIQAAQQARISSTLVQSAHLALDIDTFADLQTLEHCGSEWFSMARFAM